MKTGVLSHFFGAVIRIFMVLSLYEFVTDEPYELI